MARDIFVNGETMVTVKGSSSSSIASLSQLGLSEGPVKISPRFKHMDVKADAWGNSVPFEIQTMLFEAQVSMTLVHFDRDVLTACINESIGGSTTEGSTKRAGARLGNGAALYAATNHFISLGLSSPQAGSPWRFFTTFLIEQPLEFPIGTERSLVQLTFRAIPYPRAATAGDPWGAGSGALAETVWDHGTLS